MTLPSVRCVVAGDTSIDGRSCIEAQRDSRCYCPRAVFAINALLAASQPGTDAEVLEKRKQRDRELAKTLTSRAQHFHTKPRAAQYDGPALAAVAAVVPEPTPASIPSANEPLRRPVEVRREVVERWDDDWEPDEADIEPLIAAAGAPPEPEVFIVEADSPYPPTAPVRRAELPARNLAAVLVLPAALEARSGRAAVRDQREPPTDAAPRRRAQRSVRGRAPVVPAGRQRSSVGSGRGLTRAAGLRAALAQIIADALREALGALARVAPPRRRTKDRTLANRKTAKKSARRRSQKNGSTAKKPTTTPQTTAA